MERDEFRRRCVAEQFSEAWQFLAGAFFAAAYQFIDVSSVIKFEFALLGDWIDSLDTMVTSEKSPSH